MVIPTTKLLLMYFGFVSSSTNFFFSFSKYKLVLVPVTESGGTEPLPGI